jgi:cation:H+ antiporter
MLINLMMLIIGFVLLIKGADYFVEGAASIAGIFRVPAVIVGLTIVAFGTSAPEAAVSTTAALSGANAIAISNIIGSNIFNLLLVLGFTSLITVIPVPKSMVTREFKFLLLMTILMSVLILYDFEISRIDGFIFLGFLAFYVTWLIYGAVAQRTLSDIEEVKYPLWLAIITIIGGITAVIAGGHIVVNNATDIALNLGWSEKLVGLTIVSIGTSLPELVTSFVAAKKGRVDIAIGNVVGSNVFNILFILGLSSTITPITVEHALYVDILFMTFGTILTYYLCRTNDKLNKKEGVIMLLTFLSYMIFILVRN